MFEKLFSGRASKARPQPQNAQLVKKSAEIRTQSFAPSTGSAPRVDKFVHAAGEPGKCARGKFFQFEGVKIESALRFRIGREQNLKAAIHEKAFEGVGSNATADSVGRFN